MALTSAQIVQVFEILGIPKSGSGLIVTSLSHVPPSLADSWTSTYTEGDFSEIVTKVSAALAALDSDQVARVQTWLTQWASICSYRSLKLNGDVQMDFQQEMQHVRDMIGTLIGISVPFGGFLKETQRQYQPGLGDR